MCKLDRKVIEKQFDTVVETVRDPAYICRKCARVANRKAPLCKPKPLYSTVMPAKKMN